MRKKKCGKRESKNAKIKEKMLEELRELVETASNPAMQTGRDLRGKTDQIKGRKSEEEQFI